MKRVHVVRPVLGGAVSSLVVAACGVPSAPSSAATVAVASASGATAAPLATPSRAPAPARRCSADYVCEDDDVCCVPDDTDDDATYTFVCVPRSRCRRSHDGSPLVAACTDGAACQDGQACVVSLDTATPIAPRCGPPPVSNGPDRTVCRSDSECDHLSCDDDQAATCNDWHGNLRVCQCDTKRRFQVPCGEEPGMAMPCHREGRWGLCMHRSCGTVAACRDGCEGIVPDDTGKDCEPDTTCPPPGTQGHQECERMVRVQKSQCALARPRALAQCASLVCADPVPLYHVERAAKAAMREPVDAKH